MGQALNVDKTGPNDSKRENVPVQGLTPHFTRDQRAEPAACSGLAQNGLHRASPGGRSHQLVGSQPCGSGSAAPLGRHARYRLSRPRNLPVRAQPRFPLLCNHLERRRVCLGDRNRFLIAHFSPLLNSSPLIVEVSPIYSKDGRHGCKLFLHFLESYVQILCRLSTLLTMLPNFHRKYSEILVLPVDAKQF